MNHNQGNEPTLIEVDGMPVETHELTYAGKVDLPDGTILGPGINGRTATVVGCIYDAAERKSTVIVEAVTPPREEIPPLLAAAVSMIASSYNERIAELQGARS